MKILFNPAQLSKEMLVSFESLAAELQGGTETELTFAAVEFPNKLEVRGLEKPLPIIWDADVKCYRAEPGNGEAVEPEKKETEQEENFHDVMAAKVNGRQVAVSYSEMTRKQKAAFILGFSEVAAEIIRNG